MTSWWGMSWWMWVLMAAATTGFWAVVVLALRELLAPRGARRSSAPDEALRLLDERLARGEIDAEQYVEAKRLLTRGP